FDLAAAGCSRMVVRPGSRRRLRSPSSCPVRCWSWVIAARCCCASCWEVASAWEDWDHFAANQARSATTITISSATGRPTDLDLGRPMARRLRPAGAGAADGTATGRVGLSRHGRGSYCTSWVAATDWHPTSYMGADLHTSRLLQCDIDWNVLVRPHEAPRNLP